MDPVSGSALPAPEVDRLEGNLLGMEAELRRSPERSIKIRQARFAAERVVRCLDQLQVGPAALPLLAPRQQLEHDARVFAGPDGRQPGYHQLDDLREQLAVE